jgi:hypothetical protein
MMCNLCNPCNLTTGPGSEKGIFVRIPRVVGSKYDPPARHTGYEDAPVAQVAHGDQARCRFDLIDWVWWASFSLCCSSRRAFSGRIVGIPPLTSPMSRVPAIGWHHCAGAIGRASTLDDH